MRVQSDIENACVEFYQRVYAGDLAYNCKNDQDADVGKQQYLQHGSSRIEKLRSESSNIFGVFQINILMK